MEMREKSQSPADDFLLLGLKVLEVVVAKKYFGNINAKNNAHLYYFYRPPRMSSGSGNGFSASRSGCFSSRIESATFRTFFSTSSLRFVDCSR